MKQKGRLSCINIPTTLHWALPGAILRVRIACHIIGREEVFVISLKGSILLLLSLYPVWVGMVDRNDTAICQGLGETHG